MNLAIELQAVTAAEITASYRAANLRRLRPGYSLLTALNTPCVERALRLHALALRRKQATINQPEETSHDHRFETQ
jgi:hypothetical protein